MKLVISILLSLLLLMHPNIFASSKKPIRSTPIIKNKVWYFYNTNPIILQPFNPTKRQVEQYYIPLYQALKKRNTETDAKQAFAKGQKTLLGIRFKKQLNPMAWIQGASPVDLVKFPTAYIEGDTCINSICPLYSDDYCQKVKKCRLYIDLSNQYRTRFNKKLYQLNKAKTL